MKHTVLYGSARKGDYLIVAIKNRSVFHFQGDTIVAGLPLVQMKGARSRATVATLSLCETSTVQGHFLAGG